ncbi:tripartite tricarboxylate transporter TctB family protein [Cohaesibacter gelatinilyticus]|uniref:Tripartite tricarboxylate transporter TctB family protein n=1 Tax=Cohaesibacter gelatinilyticus TaxID=372072 RepID=A0A285PIN5_9HYPH|nr:tripartite tricarboxylate transporter TctB family protein [Cohaesibacter gelatinilyticus]SNZ21143.1 Tripartite tricarboxylate transporter TctB family protein [Cohaesibacter gelatinilyticus]
MFNERSKDILFCSLTFIAASAVLITSFSYQPASAYFPQLLAIFIAILAVTLGINRLKASADPTADAEAEKSRDLADLAGFAKVVISILAYTGLMLVVGFPLATFLFLSLTMVISGERRPLLVLPVALGLTGLLYFLFFWFLGVYPPEALLFELI